MPETIRPFANGSQFADWCDKNCGNCKKASEEWSEGGSSPASCEIEVALWNSYSGAGVVSPEIAARMNYTTPDGRNRALDYCWPCGEIEPKSDKVAQAVCQWREKDAAEAAR